MNIILASNSPRRKQLLEECGYNFTIIKSSYNENLCSKMSPKNLAKELAYNKAYSVYKSQKNNDVLVIGADTIVVYKGKIIGKPKNENDAFNTLKMLSNKKHYVYTGYAIITKNKVINKYCKSKVFFNSLTDSKIKNYIDSGLPLDKAGSYGIQDGFNVVKKFKGSYNNIVGLPIEKINKILKKMK